MINYSGRRVRMARSQIARGCPLCNSDSLPCLPKSRAFRGKMWVRYAFRDLFLFPQSKRTHYCIIDCVLFSRLLVHDRTAAMANQ